MIYNDINKTPQEKGKKLLCLTSCLNISVRRINQILQVSIFRLPESNVNHFRFKIKHFICHISKNKTKTKKQLAIFRMHGK